MLKFEGTNGLPVAIHYVIGVDLAASNAPAGSFIKLPSSSRAILSIGAGKTFVLSVVAPAQKTNWCVTWSFLPENHNLTRWEQAQMGCGAFLTRHNMRALARIIGGPYREHFILSSELKE